VTKSSAAIECQFQALRYFHLDGTDHRSHEEQNSMIRRYIAWRNRHTDNEETSCHFNPRKRCLMRHLYPRSQHPRLYRDPVRSSLSGPSVSGYRWRSAPGSIRARSR
jgi:hypothetical protein